MPGETALAGGPRTRWSSSAPMFWRSNSPTCGEATTPRSHWYSVASAGELSINAPPGSASSGRGARAGAPTSGRLCRRWIDGPEDAPRLLDCLSEHLGEAIRVNAVDDPVIERRANGEHRPDF